MQLELGPLRVTAAGGADRQGGGDGPAVLLCHGFGAPGDDLVPFARVVDAGRDVRWFFPEAPLALDLGWGVAGRAWWHIDMIRLQEEMMRGRRLSLAEQVPEGLAEARAALEACIEALCERFAVPRDRLVIGGFSQGAMITTEIGLHAATPFAGLALLSGNLLNEGSWRPAARGSGPTQRVFMSHGRADPILPFEGAEALRRLLEESAAEVEWVPHGGQHEIPPLVVQRLGAFLRRRLGT
jgi:phospholipase/carboxylesterase